MNMYPDTMTIYRHSIVNGADTYTKQVVQGVYWVETDGVAKEGKGFTIAKDLAVTTSKALANTLGTEWTIQTQDRIIKGSGANITSLKDIPNAFVVTTISKYQCGGRIDNIVIKGA